MYGDIGPNMNFYGVCGVNGCALELLIVTSGTSQGYILGPTLFAFHINDSCSDSKLVKFILCG